MFDYDVRSLVRQRKSAFAAAIGCVTMLALLVSPALAQHGPQYKVTVTNLTRGSNFAPILVASHAAGLKLFVLGSPASPELETLAERGNPVPLQNAIAPYTFDSTVMGGLAPGASETAMVQTRGQYDQVSVAGMLVPTNDGFFAVNGVEGPNGNKAVVLVSPAYDAGTEENDESCAAPSNGGPCGTGPSVGEGYVFVHAGIHGVGTLIPARTDWRNPVAKIVIERVP